MGVRVADCRADEWLLCVATPELKERLVRRTEKEKKVIESGKHSQKGSIPAHWKPRPSPSSRSPIGSPIMTPLCDWPRAARSVNVALSVTAAFSTEKG